MGRPCFDHVLTMFCPCFLFIYQSLVWLNFVRSFENLRTHDSNSVWHVQLRSFVCYAIGPLGIVRVADGHLMFYSAGKLSFKTWLFNLIRLSCSAPSPAVYNRSKHRYGRNVRHSPKTEGNVRSTLVLCKKNPEYSQLAD